MISALDAAEQCAATLVAALDGHDAGVIISATEALAAAVARLAARQEQPSEMDRTAAVINRTITQLEAAAIRVNILNNWVRQRLDRQREQRGIALNGYIPSY